MIMAAPETFTAGWPGPAFPPVLLGVFLLLLFLLTHSAQEPQVVGFTTTSTYQEAREPEEWKAMLANLISARLVVNDGRTF